MDWESWLRAAAKRPSDHENEKRDRTEAQIRDALNDWPALDGRPYRVYVKGSYANNTNVRLNYDVDIAVEYHGYFYSDLLFDLKDHDQAEVGVVDSTDPYTPDNFKRDILDALVSAYGANTLEKGNIAFRVRADKTTLPADVVPCFEYRRYDRLDAWGNPVVHVGSRVFPTKGMAIDNFPRIQKTRGTAKNLATNRRYKRMVRCLKKLQTQLVKDGVLDEELPSYLVECIVFNVPDWRFNDETYLANMRSVLSCIWAATQDDGEWADWEEVHGLHYLFKGTKWDRLVVHNMVDKVWDKVGIS